MIMNRTNTESPTTTITDLCKEISNQKNRSPTAAVRSARRVSFAMPQPLSTVKKTRKVKFSNEPVTKIHHLPNVPPSSSMTPREKQNQWYTCTELIQFRDDAKSLAMRIRILATNDEAHQQYIQNNTQQIIHSKQQKIGGGGGQHSPEFLNMVKVHARGLETRIFVKRQLKKYIATKTILECQRQIKIKLNSAELQNKAMGVEMNDISLLKKVYASKLAVLSSQQTKWAKDVARMTGNCDYETVYKCNNDNKEQRGVPQAQIRKRTSPPPSSICEKRTLTPQTAIATNNSESYPFKKQRREYTKMVVHPAMMNPIPFVPPVNVQSVQ